MPQKKTYINNVVSIVITQPTFLHITALVLYTDLSSLQERLNRLERRSKEHTIVWGGRSRFTRHHVIDILGDLFYFKCNVLSRKYSFIV